jgi:integrase
MGRNKAHELPQMRKVQRGNRAYARVRINGTDHFLGRWGSAEAGLKYDEIVLQCLEQRRQATSTGPVSARLHVGAPVAERAASRVVATTAAPPEASEPVPEAITVVEVVDRYLEHCTQWYRGLDGKITSTYGNALQAARALEPFHMTPAHLFGPKKLKAVMEALVAQGRPRVGVNRVAKAIRRLFAWAVAEELVPPSVDHGLRAVQMLQRGRTTARELPKIKPVAADVVEATLPFMSPVVADMVRFQRLTGARPGEVCVLRPCDIDRSGPVWSFRPIRHKNQWRSDGGDSHDRTIYIGPSAQSVIRPYLDRDPDAYCFSPVESERQRRRKQRQLRKSPLTPSQKARKPVKNRARPPRDCYDSASYRRAISRAVAAANKARDRDAAKSGKRVVPLEDWAPNRLRHARATEVRRKFGLEASQVILGHATADVTQIYAERNEALARDVALTFG